MLGLVLAVPAIRGLVNELGCEGALVKAYFGAKELLGSSDWVPTLNNENTLVPSALGIGCSAHIGPVTEHQWLHMIAFPCLR